MLKEMEILIFHNRFKAPRLLETAALVAAGETLRASLIARTPFENCGDAGALNKRTQVGDGPSPLAEVHIQHIL